MESIPLTTGVRRKHRKRVGRGPGSGHGKTSCRGHKGQKARSGFSRKLAFEGGQMPLNRRLPKHGFHHGRRFPYAIVNVDDLERLFEPNSEVTPETLLQAGLIKPAAGGVKVLGRGEVAKPLRIQANAVSAGARRKIEAAGGTFEVVRDKSSAPQGDAQEGC